jgi:hypothetical protein
LAAWLKDYAKARYGAPGAEPAWEILAESVYGKQQAPHFQFSWRFRPGDQPLVASLDPTQLKAALEALLGQRQLYGSQNFRRDLVDVTKTWLGAIADRFLEQALQGNDEGQSRFEDALQDLDAILAIRPEHRLSTWLQSARGQTGNENDAGHFEQNARSLITWWGGSFLFDYATREWAGLIKDFHIKRWRMWFDWRNGVGPEPDFAQWERAWSESTAPPEELEPEDEIETAQALFNKYKDMEFAQDPRIEVIRLEPQPAKAGCVEVDLGKVTMALAAACCPIFGQGMKARYRAETSLDAVTWNQTETAITCRGIRIRLDQLTRYLRFWVEKIEGSEDQLFQVVLFTNLRLVIDVVVQQDAH